jgi:hypothetical protein
LADLDSALLDQDNPVSYPRNLRLISSRIFFELKIARALL